MKPFLYSTLALLLFVSCAGRFSIKKRRYNGGLYFAYSKPVKVTERATVQKDFVKKSAENGGENKDTDKSRGISNTSSETIKKETGHKDKPVVKTPAKQPYSPKKSKSLRSRSYFSFEKDQAVSMLATYTTHGKKVTAAKPGRFKKFLMLVLLCVVAAAIAFFVSMALSAGPGAAMFLIIAGVLFLGDLVLLGRLIDS